LKKFELFRVKDYSGRVSPQLWRWDGEYVSESPSKVYLCLRLSDNFKAGIREEQIVKITQLEDL